MRVTHVVAPAAFGGLERVLADLLPAMARKGVSVDCIAVLEPGIPQPAFLTALSASGVNVVIVRVGAREYARERREVLRQLARLGSTIVHTHGYRSDMLIGTAARRAEYAVVSTLHGFTRQGWRGRLYEWLQIRSVRKFVAVVAVSTPLAKELEHRGVPREKIHIILNGISADASTLVSRVEARHALDLPQDVPVIGWIGRLSEEKNPELAMATLAKIGPSQALLAVVGDGPLRTQVEAVAKRLGVRDRVRLLGPVPEAGRLVRAFNVVLLTSRTEGTPMVILEAALGEVPVVATAVGGVPALLTANPHLLVRPGDAAGLARATATLLGNETLATREGKALADGVHRSIDGDWVSRYLSLYESLRPAHGELPARPLGSRS